MFRSKIPRMFNFKKRFLKKMVCRLLEGIGQWKRLLFYSKSGDDCFGHFHDGWQHDHLLRTGFDGARSVYSIHYGTLFNLNRSIKGMLKGQIQTGKVRSTHLQFCGTLQDIESDLFKGGGKDKKVFQS
ncbi:hypothetical protein SADUNF_Sadunf08G0114800 [Salix dunnii]|uniref:Uncharacterized protein n=1 Tax=Salix dunnii TaxID=1413687 RepID=A0A835K0D9_9ROSI|nr:hypothetical protein SADUNF_Sadunf08G0114800 [Salix dunnii]